MEEFLEGVSKHGALYGGNTACVEVVEDGGRLILDAGTGLRELGLVLAGDPEETDYYILMSHCHWDHIQGFPFFTPVFEKGSKITITSASRTIVDAFSTQQKHPYFPVPFDDVPAEVRSLVFDPKDEQHLAGFKVAVMDAARGSKSAAKFDRIFERPRSSGPMYIPPMSKRFFSKYSGQ